QANGSPSRLRRRNVSIPRSVDSLLIRQREASIQASSLQSKPLPVSQTRHETPPVLEVDRFQNSRIGLTADERRLRKIKYPQITQITQISALRRVVLQS